MQSMLDLKFSRRFYIIACLGHSSTPKKEPLHYSETSVNFYPITRRHILEDGTLQM
jgi:hypothetical protein